MPLTLKQNLDQVLNERGFPAPMAYAASTNPADSALLAIANAAAAEIIEGGYQRLRKTGTVSMVTGTTEYALPADFHEYIPDTAYQDARLDAVDLPTTAGTWAYINAGGPQAYWLRCRFLGGSLHILNPVNGVDLRFEYGSNTPIQATGGGALKERFTADTDEWLLDDRLLQLETKWRWERTKGFGDWQASLAEARARRMAVRGRDAGAKTLTPSEPSAYPPEPYTNLWV